ncbi:MAG: nucleotidyltransferase family protein [Terracidiphilus sp.]
MGTNALDRNTTNLLRAVVWPPAERRGPAVAELATKISDWKETIDAALQHGILPILYLELVANRTAIPAEALEIARIEFESNAFHCLANAAELLEVLKAFKKAGIAAMPFKGVVLAASAYGDIIARPAGDLDVLIRFSDLLQATQILKERGYELKTKVLEDGYPEAANYFEYHFDRPEDGMVVELRWRLELTQPRYRHNLGIDWVWPRRRMVKLAGADVPNFDAVTGLLMLCMHGSKHAWSRLVWICDVAKLIEREPELDWDSVRREAKRVGLWQCLALGVLLAGRVASARVPPEVRRDFEADRRMRNLTEFLEEHLVEEPGKMPGGWMPYNLQILGFRDRSRVILSPSFLRPGEHDRAIVKLPKILEPLYYVIRPLRILLDRTAR